MEDDTRIFNVMRNVKAYKAGEHKVLLSMQTARTKANHKCKPAYQAKIDAYFFGE